MYYECHNLQKYIPKNQSLLVVVNGKMDIYAPEKSATIPK